MDKSLKIIIIGAAITGLIVSSFIAKKSIKYETLKKDDKLFISDFLPLLNGFSNGDDADERLLIYEELGKAYTFKHSSLHYYGKNYYVSPGRLHSMVTIYEIVEPIEQQKIIQSAHKIKNKFQIRPFSVEFYKEETGPSPSNQFLRKVRID